MYVQLLNFFYCIIFFFLRYFLLKFKVNCSDSQFTGNIYDLICLFLWKKDNTFVIPMAPIFPLYDVVACPAPTIPDIILEKPSAAMPRLIACGGGGDALDMRAAAK